MHKFCEKSTDVHFVSDRGAQFKTLDSLQRSYCFAHMINNIVETMCDDAEIKEIISNTASLVRYMKRSGLNFRKKLALKSYCKTRWSTVNNMLQSIMDNTIFALLERRQNSGLPAHRNCVDRVECLKRSTLMKIVRFLKPFKEWTDRIEGDIEVTIYNVWPTFVQITEHIAIAYDIEMEADEDFKLIEAIKCLGRQYIAKIHQDIYPTDEQRIAVVLHPKMKRLCRMTNEDREDAYGKVDRIIRSQTLEASATSRSKTVCRPASLDELIDSDDDVEINSPCSQEFNRYLSQKVQEVSDLRAWWFENRKQFPHLFKLFLNISCIPASSAPAQRTFSTAGAIITDRRSALLLKSVSSIMLVRHLYQK